MGIFGATDGACIEDLYFDNIQLDLGCNMQNVGLLVGKSKNTTFRNITMSGRIFESDGKDHSVSNIGGLIGSSENDVLENCTIGTGSSFYTWGCTSDYVCMGGIAGLAQNTTFNSCTNYALVRGIDDEVGGIAGDATNCQFTSCINYGRVEGYNFTGGIVGRLIGSSIVRSANHGMVAGSATYLLAFTNLKYEVAGIAGVIRNSEISKCLNSGCILGGDNIGGIAGYNEQSSKINHCINVGKITGDSEADICGYKEGLISSYNYYLAENQTATGDGGTTFTSDQIPNGSIALIMNQDLTAKSEQPIWRQNLGMDYLPSATDTSKPIVSSTLSEVDIVIPVYSANDFYMAINLDRKAKISLQADLDLYSMDWNMGSLANPFEGEIEGNGHVIRNLKVEVPAGGSGGLFSYAKNAKFKNFIIDGFHFTQALNDNNGQKEEGLLVHRSENCEFKNITVRNSSIKLNQDKDYLNMTGGITSQSSNCSFEDITVESSCEFYAYSGISRKYSNVGGIVGWAEETTFTRCHNAAHLWGDDDRVGGICGHGKKCSFNGCLNSGWIEGQECVGGIAGSCSESSITRCVNVGTVSDDEHKAESYRGGIVGYMDDNSTEAYCMNFGTVYDMGSHCGALEGALGGGSHLYGWNYYNYTTNGGAGGNNNNEFSQDMDVVIPSGQFACENDFYQSIDNDGYFTDKPVPVPAAGKVYLSYRCDGSSVYTNLFHGEAGHTPDPDDFGYCQQCGQAVAGVADETTITITNAQQLKQLALYVAAGKRGGVFNVELANDIDMSEMGEWKGIGSKAAPYCGTFDGRGHRILNMHAVPNPITLNAGFFACLGDKAEINNLIIDASCQVTGNGKGVAGIAGGAVTNTENGTYITIHNCGNEANVTGELNAAGILGVLYDGSEIPLIIYDCYNTGNIIGGSESAAIVGYGQKWFSAQRCWNTGTITGADPFHSLFRYNYSESYGNFIDNYYSEALKTKDDKASSIPAEQFTSGELCYLLNTNSSTEVWGQNIGTELYPIFSTSGLRHERTMTSSWGTVMLPFKLTSGDDVTYYELNSLSDDLTLNLKRVDTVAPNSPCFFRVPEGTANVTFSIAGNEFESAGTASKKKSITLESGKELSLIGSYTRLSIKPDQSENSYYNYYIAQNKLWWGEVKFTLPAYRAYLCIGDKEGSNLAKVMTLNIIDDGTNGISDVGYDNVSRSGKPIYNIMGQRLPAGRKGLQIVNGRVVFVK